MPSPKKLYLLLALLCFGGYFLIALNLFEVIEAKSETSLCIIKNVTNVPCPACGTTRSVLKIVNGNFSEGFLINPLGYLSAAVLFIFPFWIISDLIRKRDTLYRFIIQSINVISKRPVAIVLIVLLLMNWIWNINKGL